MNIIVTGPRGDLAYWAAHRPRHVKRAFGMQGRFRKPQLCSFARLPAFGANGNCSRIKSSCIDILGTLHLCKVDAFYAATSI